MIDTHSHIYGPEFDEDRELVVQRARETGVEKILLPNINEDTIEPMLDMCARYPGYLYPMMGLHPEDITDSYQQVLDRMECLLREPGNPYVAVGEVGLDYYWDKTYYQLQQEVFERQVCWARDFDLPLMIHARSAQAELVEIMERHRDEHLRGVFHCFGGTQEEAEELLSFDGFVLGIGGVLTFKKSKLPEVLKQCVPLDRIVLETDSPYLAPVPHRGGRNESSFVVEVANTLAYIYNVSVVEVTLCTNANVKRIFGTL